MRLLAAIYREYFENNHDLSDRTWLLDIGTSLTDLPAAEIQACLESEEWDQAIDRLSDRNKQEFRAVPVFIIQGRFVAGGWQSPEKFLEVFERIRLAGPNAPGKVLSVPGGGWWMPGGVFQGASQTSAPVPSSGG
jgi:predicted DsbA family dithiol-disulfide isomerase